MEFLSRLREEGEGTASREKPALTRRCAPPSPAGGRGAVVNGMPLAAHGDSGSSPRISRMPSPGASLIEISDSLKVTPPSTGSKAHSDEPTRSSLVIPPDLDTATWTAAAQSMLV